MTQQRTSNRRLIAVGLAAAAILIALVLATGGGFSGSNSPQTSPTSPPAPTSARTAQDVSGVVSVQVRHVTQHGYSFVYIVDNRGRVPIAGFQINGGRANLFHVRGPRAWNAFGAGVCGGRYPNVLVYWSTGSSPLMPGHSAKFSFLVNTGGVSPLLYSLSQGQSVLFGHARGPRPSSLPSLGRCNV
ncbi:MAG: hypothetical protein ACR2JC_08685 [Chloroflexota bacterium]|nr:MAG: hypothetical protein DLM70_18945 [Chloroflexota bacterium]